MNIYHLEERSKLFSLKCVCMWGFYVIKSLKSMHHGTIDWISHSIYVYWLHSYNSYGRIMVIISPLGSDTPSRHYRYAFLLIIIINKQSDVCPPRILHGVCLNWHDRWLLLWQYWGDLQIHMNAINRLCHTIDGPTIPWFHCIRH